MCIGGAAAWRRRLAPLLLLTALGLLLSGCSIGYYAQAIGGHMDLMSRRQDITAVLAAGDTDEALRTTLARVLEIRDFASRELGLPDNDSYRTFADLERPYVVWNVVAVPEFSMAPKQWCFPFVGCLAYKGWFDRERAEREARRLEARGYDVDVGGVAAYSTLGRFDDPFLNTMAGYGEARTAALIFHELAHQHTYVRGETAFNEAFASFVAEVGVRRWLAYRDAPALLARWEAAQRRQQQFTALVLDARERLAELYAREDLDETALRRAKAGHFARLREDYARLKRESWDGYDGYDGWFETLNNAKLVSVATYRRLLPAFSALLVRAGGDFEAFLASVEALAAAPAAERDRRLAALMAVSDAAQSAGRSPSRSGRWWRKASSGDSGTRRRYSGTIVSSE